MDSQAFTLWQTIEPHLPRIDGTFAHFESIGPIQALLLGLRPAISIEFTLSAACQQILHDAGFFTDGRWLYNHSAVVNLQKEHPTVWQNTKIFADVHTHRQDGILFGFPDESVKKFAAYHETKDGRAAKARPARAWCCDAYGTTWMEYEEISTGTWRKLQEYQTAFAASGLEDITLPLFNNTQRDMAYCVKIERVS